MYSFSAILSRERKAHRTRLGRPLRPRQTALRTRRYSIHMVLLPMLLKSSQKLCGIKKAYDCPVVRPIDHRQYCFERFSLIATAEEATVLGYCRHASREESKQSQCCWFPFTVRQSQILPPTPYVISIHRRAIRAKANDTSCTWTAASAEWSLGCRGLATIEDVVGAATLWSVVVVVVVVVATVERPLL
jgi:hypothetical protein